MNSILYTIKAMDSAAWLLLVGAPLLILIFTITTARQYTRRLSARAPEALGGALPAKVDVWDFWLGIASLVLVFGALAYWGGSLFGELDSEEIGACVFGIAALFPAIRRKILGSRPVALLARNVGLRVTSIVLGVVGLVLAVAPVLHLGDLIRALKGAPTDTPSYLLSTYAWMGLAAAVLAGAAIALYAVERSRYFRMI